jgi:hypothetical protein
MKKRKEIKKTKPVGVRLSLDLVEKMANEGVLTAQGVVNRLEDIWRSKMAEKSSPKT